MKVLLAGGFGTRLSEETDVRPKPMVEIGGKPMLWHIMKIYLHYGFDEIYLLGMDHNYMCKSENDWRFYKDGIHQKDETKRTLQDKSHTQHAMKATGKIFEHYQILKDNNRNKIYNCSDESLLDIFEYKNIGEILK
jgi:NDP-sugar pyrophosphorylase family protein